VAAKNRGAYIIGNSIIYGHSVSYKPEIREDLLSRLYHYKHSLVKKIPITRLVNEAIEEYLNRKTNKNIKNKKVKKERS
jgi:hypothetical protein